MGVYISQSTKIYDRKLARSTMAACRPVPSWCQQSAFAGRLEYSPIVR